VRASRAAKRHVITTAIEHPAVLYTCRALQKEGVEVTFLRVSAEGIVDPADVRKSLRPETVLVTIMHANNEIGTIQPIAEIAAIAREAAVPFHTDAVQSTGKIPIDVQTLGIDLLSLSAHKFNGPKGTGVLFKRNDITLAPVLFGGHGEHDPRPGTANVAGIAGLGAAAQLAGETLDQERARVSSLRDRLEEGILARIEDAGVNGPRRGLSGRESMRVPNTTNLYFDYVEGEALVIALDLQGIACSTGSACSSGAVEPSHVLTAIGAPAQRARSSLRLSLGRQTTADEVDILLEALPKTVERLRALSPQVPAAARHS